MSIPLIIFLILYLLVLTAFLVFTFFNIYHAWRFGFWDKGNFIIMIVYLIILLVVLLISVRYILTVNWGEELSFFTRSVFGDTSFSEF